MGVQKVRVAVNGYGVIGKRVAAAVAQQDDMSLAGVSDVVCGMLVDPAKAAGSGEFNGKTYYFCSKGCKTKFDASPAQYAKIKRPVM